MRSRLLLGLGLLALFPGTAAAADQTLTFETLGDGVALTTQYANHGGTGQGPRFRECSAPGTFGERLEGEIVPAGKAQSGTHVLDLAEQNGEFPRTEAFAKFTKTKRHVRVYAGIPAGQPASAVKLTAYDAAGAVVGSQTKTVPSTGEYKTPLEVNLATARIACVKIAPTSGAPVVHVDDFTYDLTEAAVPDFGISHDWSGQFSPDVDLLPGQTKTVKLVVNRVNGSAGALKWTVDSLPPGVTAAWDPGSLTSASPVYLRLTAAANAGRINGDTIAITADPQGDEAAGDGPDSINVEVNVHGHYDMRVKALEVTQGVQRQHEACDTPASCATRASLPPRNGSTPIRYEGVTLAEGKRTVARVFADLAQGTALADAQVKLYGTRNGQPLPGSPLVREVDLDHGTLAHVALPERTDPDAGFAFDLPASWTTGTVKLKAQVVAPTVLSGGDAECPTCSADNTYELTGVAFNDLGWVWIAPARLWYEGETATCGLADSCPSPGQALAGARKRLPLATTSWSAPTTRPRSTSPTSATRSAIRPTAPPRRWRAWRTSPTTTRTARGGAGAPTSCWASTRTGSPPPGTRTASGSSPRCRTGCSRSGRRPRWPRSIAPTRSRTSSATCSAASTPGATAGPAVKPGARTTGA